ncbi:MAG TPA: hypothetical protein PK379_07865, partial [Candidatus Hydrogenedentes bacterium]|nr:hypothetical protein [Candidatus Hydrogenedentota bacterium]
MVKRRTSSGATIRIIAGFILVLAGLVVAVYLFAPGKPPPPPRSSVRYEAPRAQNSTALPAENTSEALPGPLARRTEEKPAAVPAPETETAATESTETVEPGTLTVSGVVVSGQDRRPLGGITVRVAVFAAGMEKSSRLAGNP